MNVIEFFKAQRPQPPCSRPTVTLSYAQSLDGSIAVRPDAPLTLSCPESKYFTHALRSLHDAILVGIGTVLADDPKLTARRVGGPHPRPVVLDTHLRFPDSARLLEHPRGVIIATGPHPPQTRVRALEGRGATVLPLPLKGERVDLHALLDALAAMNLCSLMVEGGSRVLTAFLRARLVDWAAITLTPHFIGGIHALSEPTTSFTTPPQHADAFPYVQDWKGEPVGRDLVIWGKMAWPG